MALLWGLAAFAIYACVTPRVSGPGDGPEFTTALATAGLPHPTGYPLYTLAGHLFARALHAFGVGWPTAANLWSGVGAAVSVSLCYVAAGRIAGRESHSASGLRTALAAAIPAIVLALNPLLLAEAVEAEVNTWSLAWTMAAAVVFLRWIDRIGAGDRISVRDHAGWGLLCGAGLAHHAMSLLVSIPLSIGLGAALAGRGRLRGSLVLVTAATALVPPLAYGFVAWRAFHPAPGQWPDIAPTLEGVLKHITGERYRMFLGFFAPDPENREFLLRWVYPFLFPGLVGLGVAAVRAASGERRIAWASLLGAVLLVVMFTQNYGVPDVAAYLLPPLALALMGYVPALTWIVWSGARAASARPGRLAAFPVLLALAITIALGWHAVPAALERRDAVTGFDAQVRRLWALVPPDSAIVLWPSDQMTRLVEYQVVRGEKPAVWVTTPEFLVDPFVRRRVRERYGVDLLRGLEIPYAPRSAPWGEAVRAEFFDKLVDRLNSGTTIPVYWFDPMGSGLTLIPKRGG